MAEEFETFVDGEKYGPGSVNSSCRQKPGINKSQSTRTVKMASKSNLDLVNECDNFGYDYKNAEKYYKFRLHGCDAVLGYVTAEVAQQLPLNDLWTRDDQLRALVFSPQILEGDPAELRTEILAQYLQSLRESKVFKILDGWRNELYPVYGPGRELLFSMERSASALFGIVTYGVHMTAFVRTDEGLKIWTPRRALNKQTYPGMMDNTVAGGLSTGEMPFECMIRESMEEASLPEEVAKNAKCCGTLTYFHVRDSRAGGEVGLCQPECQFIYDLELTMDIVPKPNDDEAIDFKLLNMSEVQKCLAEGRFKPNCALLLLEFFVRHGILTPENEPEYIEVASRLHRRLDFPMM